MCVYVNPCIWLTMIVIMPLKNYDCINHVQLNDCLVWTEVYIKS